MEILTLPKTMTEGEALKEAQKGGNILGKALYGSKEISLKLMYLESREVIFDLYYEPAPLMRWLGKKADTTPSQKIRMIVEGTRCTASYAEQPLHTKKMVVQDDIVQKTEFPDEKIVKTAKDAAVRMVRRQMGKVPRAELASMRSIFRPYYIAFYGKLEMGTKVRYLPIAADGNLVQRSL